VVERLVRLVLAMIARVRFFLSHFLHVQVANDDGVRLRVVDDPAGYPVLVILHLLGELGFHLAQLLIVPVPPAAELLAVVALGLDFLDHGFPILVGSLVLELHELAVNVHPGGDVGDTEVEGLENIVVDI